MTDFEDWYADQNPNTDPEQDDFIHEVRDAFEAGAASQVKTLRDGFAGQALSSFTEENFSSCAGMATLAYQVADAMLEARGKLKPSNPKGR
jgi:hypothetical protein